MSGLRGSVRVRELRRTFREVTAVDSLSFTVGTGELFGIVGPDGAGKTTTLRMLAGVLRPDSGDAEIGGISVVRDPEGVKHHIAYMSQRFGLYEDLTVSENLRFYADLYQVPRTERTRRLERLYRFSRLEPFSGRLAGNLSGGMKQKLGLSCALIHQPDVLLLDEPTFGVDPLSRRELWLILHEMVAEGVTVIVSTAYLDEAERCDQVAMLNEGRIIALDSPDALRAGMPGRFFVVQADRPRDARDVLRSLQEVSHAALFGDVVHATSEQSGSSLVAALEAAHIRVGSIEETEPSLEDVFMRLATTAAPAHA